MPPRRKHAWGWTALGVSLAVLHGCGSGAITGAGTDGNGPGGPPNRNPLEDSGQAPAVNDSGTRAHDAEVPTDASAAEDSSTEPLANFSFFVTSLAALQDLSGSQNGFGGDLRYGESGMGAGLRGADKICAAIAERSMPGASAKQWRAFLSASQDDHGQQVNAIDRIGSGPWYDRLGRLVAPTKGDLLGADRPKNGDATIRDDLPNEDGVPNHAPVPVAGEVDNHDTLTGSNTSGQLAGSTYTCNDWTSKAGNNNTEGKPRVGHSWPRGGGGAGGGNHWISSHDAGGCAPGVNLVQSGGPAQGDYTVGAGGGYGGFYCFALTP